ncbi:Glycosyltransferase involved in cell wall bisynthesis [Candidatus Methanophagaceae archaeon]|jgi:glycosyltransferase involved in cell wall biosynthesis|nr:Glycosyltransferase involved in cell wall bisynthesis [Methanophagales archaeon]
MNKVTMPPYILVTPVKNEEKNLPKLIPSVVRQTVRPVLWVIVDDGSTDRSPEMIEEAKGRYEWIHGILLEGGFRDLGKHVYSVYNKGFEFAIEYCKAHNIHFDYIGNVDADMILEIEFFEKLIKEFEKNRELGIASGSGYDFNNKLIMDTRNYIPLGGIRLWRKECYEETGGYPISYSADAVSNVLARLKGWKTERFNEIKAIQTRRTSSAEGLWKGYKKYGEATYFINFHPLYVLIKGLKLLFESPYYTGFAYLHGYISSALKKLGKIDNEEIRDYFYWHKSKEVIDYYKNELRKKLRWRR